MGAHRPDTQLVAHSGASVICDGSAARTSIDAAVGSTAAARRVHSARAPVAAQLTEVGALGADVGRRAGALVGDAGLRSALVRCRAERPEAAA